MAVKRRADGTLDWSTFDQFTDLNAPKAPTPFIPIFDSGNVYRATAGDIPVNLYYFASEMTSAALMQKFGASRVEGGPVDAAHPAPDGGDVSAANPGPGGMNVVASTGLPVIPRVLVFEPGAVIKNYIGLPVGRVTKEFKIKAGTLAQFYADNPESANPAFPMKVGAPPDDVTLHVLSLAEQYCWKELQAYALAGGMAPV